MDAKILNGSTGATFGLLGSGMGNWIASAPKGSSFKLSAVPYPTLSRGETPKFGAKDPRYHEPCYFISATSKNKELAARFLDYGYSEEGHMYYNFGTEGVSYEMNNGQPNFTDLILNNTEGLSATQALTMYTHCSFEGPFEMDERFFKQQYKFDAQKEAIGIWTKTNAAKYTMVGETSITSQENSEYTKIMNDITTYVNEMTTKFIIGIEPLSNFDEFTEQIKAMNIARAIEIKQAGYDRHMNK